MWECPDLFEMDGQLYIICCPQGVETQGIDYENVHQVTAMKLDYDFDTDKYEITDIKLFDRGFDFYAPQSFVDESGRRIPVSYTHLDVYKSQRLRRSILMDLENFINIIARHLGS